MAHFARQKRQSRFYWAELGFMALGLLGLQPGLLTHLIFGSPPRPSSYDDLHYQAFFHQATNPVQGLEPYRDWSQTHLASYYQTQPTNGTAGINQIWAPSQPSPSTYLPLTSYLQSPHATSQFPQPLTYAQQQQQQLFAQLPAYTGTSEIPQQQFYSPQSANYQQQLQYAPFMQPTAPTGWQNQATYLAQSSSSNTQPSLAPSGYQPSAAYQPNSYPNTLTSAYTGVATRPNQQPFFDTSYNSNYNTGTAKASSSALNYPYQPNTANTSSWQRYRAPTTPIYR